MNDVTREGTAVGLIASAPDNTPVSGPNGPLTRRYAPTAATPCLDHSDSAQRHYIAFSRSGLAATVLSSIPAAESFNEHPPKRQQQAAAAKAPEITPFTSQAP